MIARTDVFEDREVRRPHAAAPDPWKGLFAGLVGGLAGTVAMTAAQLALYQILPEPEGEGDGDEQSSLPATEEAAQAVGRRVLGRRLSEEERSWGGSAFHYGFGTAVGGAYGLAAELRPELARGQGVPFGVGLMLLADEVAVPALGLSASPQRQPLRMHLLGLGAHVVYGAVSETVRRAVRSALA